MAKIGQAMISREIERRWWVRGHFAHVLLSGLAMWAFIFVWTPAAIYLGIVFIKDIVAILIENSIYTGRPAEILLVWKARLTVFQRIMYGFLAAAIALEVDPSETIGILGLAALVYGGITCLLSPNCVHEIYGKNGFIAHSDRAFAGAFGTLAVLVPVFARTSVTSPAWHIAVLVATMLLLKGLLEHMDVDEDGMPIRTKIWRPVVLVYDMVFLSIGAAHLFFN